MISLYVSFVLGWWEGNVVELNGLFSAWRRSIIANGGYHIGTLAITDRSYNELARYFDGWLGGKLVERTYGYITYEGLIWQLDLVKDGVNYRRTFDPRVFHNKVKVKYTDSDGVAKEIDWSENTTSSELYGTMEYVYSLGKTTGAGAAAVQSRALAEHAWPSVRVVGAVNVGSALRSLRDGLYITTVGYGATMNWTHREFSEIGPASTLITTLVGETDNINVGRIESNTLSSEVDADLGPQRIGDAIMKIVSAGDASGNLWKGGVYANQYEESYQGSPNQFVYEPVPTTVDYELQGGKIYRTGGLEFPISQFLPGVYVRDTQAPPREKPPGSSNVWDDPQVSYCNECEFIWPNTLRLKFPGLRQSVATTAPSLFDVPGMGGGPHRRPWRTGGHGGAGPPRLPSTSGAGGGPFPPTGGAGSGPFPPTGTAGGAHDLPLPDDEWIGGYEPV